jgi:hypothetical protein
LFDEESKTEIYRNDIGKKSKNRKIEKLIFGLSGDAQVVNES